MRELLLMRGAPGCGKSTFIENNGFAQYVLSADTIRAMFGYEFETNYSISCGMEKDVWELLMKLLEDRMKKGMFTVIDACNSKAEDVQKFRRLAEKYRYRIFCVDFTDITPDICIERNAQRPIWKRVPESSIYNMYARFVQPLPNYVTMIKRDELYKLQNPAMELGDKYKKIKVFGDIHGCYSVLMKALNNTLDDDTYYIFAGDYVDRGIETGKLLKWMISVKDKPNVCFIEGNHDRNIWNYAEGNGLEDVTADMPISKLFENYRNDIDTIRKCVTSKRFKPYTKSFEVTTLPHIIEEKLSVKDLRQLYRKFWQCAWFKFKGQKFLVTHGGLGMMPTNEELYKISTEQMIRGTGRFDDIDEIELNFENSCSDVIQIHGHRNVIGEPTKVSDRTYNLEGSVEFGGELRWVEIYEENGEVKVEDHVLLNDVFDKKMIGQGTITREITDVPTLIEMFRSAEVMIKEKQEGHISSFNFSEMVFNTAAWTGMTVKARGLFVNTATKEIVARSYDKFFNYGEVIGTKLMALTKNLVFPVTAYIKENGFLGIVGYDKEKDELVIASKSSVSGEHAGYVKKLLSESCNDLAALKAYLKREKVSMVFEVIDVKNDPHIIEYAESHIVLLDVIKNDIKFSKLPYSEMVEVAKEFGFQHKKIAKVYNNMQELKDLLTNEKVTDEWLSGSGKYEDGYIEGYVFEDMNGFMFKYKLPYYKSWKALRQIIPLVLRYGKITRTSSLTTKTANDFYQWLRRLYVEDESYRVTNGFMGQQGKFKLIPMRNKWLSEK